MDLFRVLGNHAVHLLPVPVLDPPPYPDRDSPQFLYWSVDHVIRSPIVKEAIESVLEKRDALSSLQLDFGTDLPVVQTTTPPFKQKEKVGEGSFADVWKGHWMNDEKCPQVAFKRIHSKDESTMWREAELLFACNHPNIVSAIGLIRHIYFDGDGHVTVDNFLVMELCDCSLHDLLSKREVSFVDDACERLRIIKEIALGLSYLHEVSY